MLISDCRIIGNKLLALRKRAGLTQAEMAEKASLADRTYADIERGNANMRVSTLLKICDVLHVTPDEILTAETPFQALQQEELMAMLQICAPKEKETALKLLATYLSSLRD